MAKAVKSAVKAFAVTFLIVTGTAFIFGGAGAFAGGLANLTIFGSTVNALAISALSAVGTAVQGLFSKGIDATAENFGSKVSTRSPTNPRQIIYGKARVGGTITHIETSGTDNHKLSMIVSLAGHELESLDEVLINDISVTSTSVGLFQYATNTKFKNTDNDNKFDSNGTLLRYKFIDGSQTTADSSVTANTSLTTSDKFIDVAYVFIEMVFDSEAFGGGIPPMSFVVKGKKVYDPRDSNQTFGTESTYTWSDNPALCVLDYITNTTYGLKATADEINTSTALGSFKVAANTCDFDGNTITTATVNGAVSGTQVTLDISNSITLIDVGQLVTGTGIVGTVKVASRDGNIIKLSSAQTIADGTTLTIKEKSYTANGITNMSADGGGVIEGLLSSCAGKLSYIDGKFVMFAGATVIPDMTITDDNIIAPISVQTMQSRGETFNQVKSVYVDANNNYVATDSPLETTVNPATSNTFLSEDTPTGEAQANYKKTLEVQLPFTDTTTMAQRLQRTALLHTRQKTALSVVCNISYMQLQPFDWVYLTNERLGYTNKVFEVLSTNLEFVEDEGVPILATRLDLKEINNSVYNFASSSYTNPLDEGTSVSTGSFSVSSPTGLSVSATLINTGYDLNVQWTNIADDNIQGTEILYGTSSGTYTGSVITGKGISKEIINNVKPNTTYYIVARHFSNNNVFSAKTSEVTINTNSGTGITTPSAPTSLSATTGKPLSIGLSWTNPSNSDLRDIQIYRSTSNGFTPDDSSNLVRTIAGVPSVAQKVSFGIDDGLVAGTTYYFKVKAVSFFDKVSTASSQASGSFTKVEATDIEGIFSGYFHVEGSTTTALSDSAFNTAHGRLPIEDDILIMVNTSASPKVSKAYKYSGTAGSGGSFVEITNFTTGDLIAGETIAGNKLIANTITATQIDADTITATEIASNTITATQIASSTITATEMNVSNLSSISANIGTITSGSLNIGSGAFTVSTAGVLSATGATVSGSITSTSGTIGGFTLGTTSLTAGSNTTRLSLSTADGIHLGNNTFSSAPFRVTRAGELTATNANVTGDLETGNLIVTGNAGIHGEVRATSLTAGTVTVASINQEVWNEIDARTAPTQNGFYDNYDSTSTGTYYNGVATNFELLGSGGNGYLSNGQSISIRTSMVHGYAQQGSQTYTGDALKATFQFQYKTLPSGNWTNFGSAYVGVTDAYTIPNGFFYELDADPDASVNLSNGVYYQFRLRVTPTVTNNVWADSDANDVFAIAFAIQQSSTGTGAGTGTVTSVGSGDGLSGGPITGSGTLTVDSTVVRTSGVQTLGGNKTFSDNVVIQGDLDVQGTTTTIDTANLDVKDKNITLNYSTGDSSASANGAGITIQDAVSSTQDATLTWNTANDSFNFSHPLNVTGNIGVTGTVDGRDIATDGTKLDGIEAGATTDQTQADINALAITEVGTITSGTWNGSVIASAYLDADTAHLSGTQTFTGDKTFADNVKAQFGTSNDLQIYHDGHSYIKDTGSGNLVFDTNGNGMFFKHGDETLFEAYADGAVNLRYDNSPKLATSSSGIDVTGTVTADNAIFGTTSDSQTIVYITSSTTGESELRLGDTDTDAGSISYTNSNDTLTFRAAAANRMSLNSSGLDVTGTVTSDGVINNQKTEFFASQSGLISSGSTAKIYATNTSFDGVNGSLVLQSRPTTGADVYIATGATAKKVAKFSDGGDISFYEDTGTTAKFFWDASAERLGIGTSPDEALHIYHATANINAIIESGDANAYLAFKDNSTSSNASVFLGASANDMTFFAGGTDERMRLDSAGNLFINQTATGDYTDTAGSSFRATGFSTHTRDGGDVLLLNRLSSDGNILLFRKDNSTVGSIGTEGGNLYIDGNPATGKTGIEFLGSAWFPRNDGANSNGAVDLGDATNRFKDLYLSGTANIDKALIGTSSAGATDAKLTLENGFSDCSIYIGAGGDYNYIRSIRNANNDHDLAIGKNYSGGSDAEHLRITNEGNLLVGKNSDDGTAGVRIGGSGTIVPIASGIPIIADRLSSDGEIIRFRKDGGTVGSIGNNTDFYIASQDGTGLRFTNNQILPCSESGAIQNTSRDLGSSSGKFRDLYLSGTANTGNIVTTGYLRGPSTFTIDPAAHGDDTGTVVIAGNLQVDGTTTTINSTTLTVDDKNITLASGSTNAAAANGAGLTVDCGSDTDATFTYDGTNDEWDFNKNITTTGHYIADTHFRSSDGNATLSATGGGGVYLRPDGNSNSANQVFIASGTGNATFAGTISSGDIDVTGTVTADGLTVDGTATINGTTPLLYLTESDTTDLNSRIRNTAGNFQIHTANDAQNSFTARLNISHSTGDISFYEDTGTTAKFFWDASTERLGLGTDNPSVKLHIEEAITGDASQLRISNGAGATLRMGITGSGANEAAHIKTNSGENLEFHIGQAANATTPTMRISSTVVDVNVFLDLNDNYITGVNSYRNVAGNEIIDSNNTSYTIVKSYAGVNRLWLGETSTYANNNNFFFRDTGSNHLVTINSDGLDIRSGGLDINSLEVIDSSRNLTNIGTISSGAITSTGISNFQRDIRSAGQIRATGWYNATATTDYTGMALEIGVSGTQPHILAYNRDTTSYGAMQIHSAGLTIDPRSNDVTIKGVVNLTSSGHLEINGTTVIDSSRNLTNIGTISSGAINTTGAITIDVDDQADGALRIEANQTNPDNDFYFAQEITSTLSGTTATTGDREQGGIYMDINSTATGGDTSNEHRAYGMHIDLDSTGDADLVYGVYSNATATPTTGSTTNVYGGYFHAEDNGGNGQVSTLIGVQGTSVSDNSTSDVNAMYGGYFKNYNQTDSAAITASTAVYGEIEIPSGTGDIYGTSYIFRAEYDNNSTVAQTNTTYLYYGNYAGVLPTNAYGVYIADAVDNYFAGSISSGAITSTGLTVATASGAVINLQDTGSHNWQLATDNQDNFFKVKDGSSITYLKVGTADSEFATNLNLTSGHSYKINGTTVIDSSRKIFTPEIELGGDAEHKLRYSIGSIISGGTTHTTILQGRQVDIYGYDDIQIRAGSSDKIVLTASGSSKIQLDANTNIVNGILKIGGSTFADQSRNITAGTISSGAITSSGHIQSAGALKVTETGTSQVIMIGNQDSGGVNTPAMIMGVNGVIRIGHGSSWSGEGGTFTEKIAISGSDLKITSGGLILNATTVIDSSRNLSNIGTITTSGAIDLTGGGDTTDAGSVHLPRGSHITFYGNNNADHSIGSRNNVGGVTDDLRISSYGALYIDLDSNDNNGSSADFVIGRHGSGTGTMSNLFSVSGETGAVISNSNITAYGSASDIRLKENIEVIQNPIDKVQRLRGVTFNYKKDGSKSTGLIAQELEEVLPEVVYETHDLHDAEDKFKAVRYGNIIGLLVEAIKDQQKEIEYMKSEIKNLKENNNGN